MLQSDASFNVVWSYVDNDDVDDVSCGTNGGIDFMEFGNILCVSFTSSSSHSLSRSLTALFRLLGGRATSYINKKIYRKGVLRWFQVGVG